MSRLDKVNDRFPACTSKANGTVGSQGSKSLPPPPSAKGERPRLPRFCVLCLVAVFLSSCLICLLLRAPFLQFKRKRDKEVGVSAKERRAGTMSSVSQPPLNKHLQKGSEIIQTLSTRNYHHALCRAVSSILWTHEDLCSVNSLLSQTHLRSQRQAHLLGQQRS